MRLHEIARFVADVPATTAFYRTLLGSEPLHADEGLAIFMQDGVQIFIHRTYTPGPDDLPPENHLAFAVDDVDAACARLVGEGLTIAMPAADYYWGRSAYLRAPDGQLIELIAT